MLQNIQYKTNYLKYDEMNRAVKTVTTKDNKSKTTTTSYDYANENERKFVMGEEEKTYDFLYKQTSVSDGIESINYTDEKGQSVKSYSLGNSVYTEYDSEGRAVRTFSIEDGAQKSDGKMTMTLYDEKGHETHSIQNPTYKDGIYYADENCLITKSEYDNKGNKIRETDPMGNVTRYYTSIDNTVSKVTLDKDNVTKTEENIAEGNNTKTVTTNALGNKSEEVTDAFGNTVEVRDIGKGTEADKRIVTKYEYDINNNKTKETYQNGDCKTFAYDYDGRVIEENQYRKDSQIPSEKIEYTYDILGNITKAAQTKYDENASVKSTLYRLNTYDEFNRLSTYYEGKKENPTDEERISYEYNDRDDISKVIYPNNLGIKSVLYEYDSKYRLTQIRATTDKNSTPKVVRMYTYSPKGNVKTIKDYAGFNYSNNKYILKTYTYDKFDRVTNMNYKNSDDLKTIVEEYNYTYDKNGNILTEDIYNNYIESQPINELKEYTYDNL